MPRRARSSALGGTTTEISNQIRRNASGVTRVYEIKLLSSSRGLGHGTEAVHLGGSAHLLGDSTYESQTEAVPEFVRL